MYILYYCKGNEDVKELIFLGIVYIIVGYCFFKFGCENKMLNFFGVIFNIWLGYRKIEDLIEFKNVLCRIFK